MADDRVAILTDDEEELKRRHLERFDRLSLEIQTDQPSQPSENNVPNDSTPTPSPQHDIGCCERLFLRVNRLLLVSKVFYLFFYAAYGSLHPLLALFYKQLGMNPTQSGLLVGIRYFIEFCSAPFWGIIADRFRKGKAVLLFSMLCWLFFNCGIGMVQPPDMKCKENIPTTTAIVTTVHTNTSTETTTYLNTSSILTTNQMRQRRDLIGHYPWQTIQSSGYSSEHRFKRDSNMSLTVASDEPANTTASYQTTTTRPEPSTSISTSTPNSTNTTSSSTTSSTTLKPKLPPPEYNMDQVHALFLLILLVIIVGEFFSAPAITIVDTVTLQYLGPHRDRYGLQRMWGSLGWGIAMLCVGIWIDHTSTNFVIGNMECVMENYKNYQTAFIVFGVLMAVALIVATQFKFNVQHQENREDNEVGNQHAQNTQARGSPGTNNSGTTTIVQAEEFHFWDLLRLLCGVQYGTVLFVAWFMGFGYGFVFTFLYWHLQDLTGTTTLFGVCSVLSHVSELAAYFTSHKFIELVGHIRVLYIGLACNTARYLYISYLENAWTVLPMEVLQGITHASVWAACISYLSAAVPPPLRTSAQGILQGLHLGLGRGCGAMVGGIFVNYFGAAETFRGIGMTSLVILLLFSLTMCITGQNEKKEEMLAENIPIPFSPVPIATIDLVQNTTDMVAPARPEPKLPARKTRHQEEQEDLNKPAWVPSGSPLVSVVLLFYQIREMVIMAKTHPIVEVQQLQDTDEVPSESREDDQSPPVFSDVLRQESFPSRVQSQEDPGPPGASAQLEFPPQSVLQPNS